MSEKDLIFKADTQTRFVVGIAYLRGREDMAKGDCAKDLEEAFNRVWSDLREMPNPIASKHNP